MNFWHMHEKCLIWWLWMNGYNFVSSIMLDHHSWNCLALNTTLFNMFSICSFTWSYKRLLQKWHKCINTLAFLPTSVLCNNSQGYLTNNSESIHNHAICITITNLFRGKRRSHAVKLMYGNNNRCNNPRWVKWTLCIFTIAHTYAWIDKLREDLFICLNK